ncbi:MAG: hypothetical protein JNM70_17480, partial [Anaerolineae bacterium]|nr:hypothetical protein [Anaerolineae bacterium]
QRRQIGLPLIGQRHDPRAVAHVRKCIQQRVYPSWSVKLRESAALDEVADI